MEIFTYKNAKDFQKKFRVKNITTRTDYLQQVKRAVLEVRKVVTKPKSALQKKPSMKRPASCTSTMKKPSSLFKRPASGQKFSPKKQKKTPQAMSLYSKYKYATLSAVNALKEENGWSDAELWHEVVNRAAGEITNVNGFTTNHIENRWSLLKHWARKKSGGRLPSHSDRSKWRQLLAEFRWRKFHADSTNRNVYIVPVHKTVAAMRRLFPS
ncbi:unnamed protein product [Effrenium voratum]|uniref:Uncharacterized protein n=1 Tax=Effrenium voratum TaxID=2562239 RepID=A0AA36MV92_9DINO|nr:unnamed protein product [Effrenium voratum]